MVTADPDVRGGLPQKRAAQPADALAIGVFRLAVRRFDGIAHGDMPAPERKARHRLVQQARREIHARPVCHERAPFCQAAARSRAVERKAAMMRKVNTSGLTT